MTRIVALSLLAAVLATTACKSKEETEKELGEAIAKEFEKAGNEAANEFILDGIKKDLGEIKAKLGKGEVDGLDIDCAALTGYTGQADQIKEAAGMVKEAAQICGFDVPMMTATAALAAAEAARKAKGAEELLSECYSADYSMAIETLQTAHKDDDKVKDLVTRWAAVCPE